MPGLMYPVLGMNPFVNPGHRGVTLPLGCKDLMDVLNQSSVSQDLKVEMNNLGLIITASGLHKNDFDITIEGNIVHLTGNKHADAPAVESCLALPPGYDVSRAHATFYAGILMIVVPKL